MMSVPLGLFFKCLDCGTFPCGLFKVAIYLWDSKVPMAAFGVCNALTGLILVAHALPCKLADVLHGRDQL